MQSIVKSKLRLLLLHIQLKPNHISLLIHKGSIVLEVNNTLIFRNLLYPQCVIIQHVLKNVVVDALGGTF